MPVTRSRLRLICRIAAPFVGFFLLPRLVGSATYATFVLQFFFFTSAIGLVTSPLEHALIRLRSKPGYGTKFSQIFWAYLAIAILVSFVADLTYVFLVSSAKPLSGSESMALLVVILAAVACQVGYFLKFFCLDWYYYYAEVLNYALVSVMAVLAHFFGGLDLLTFSCLSALVYLGLTAVRLFQISKCAGIGRPQLHRIGLLTLRAFRSSTLPSLFGALIKRADSFYMPVIGYSPVAVLVYRLIRNVINSVSLVGNIHAQDVWMTRRVSRQGLTLVAYLLITTCMMILLASMIWLYLDWLGESNPLQPADLVYSGLSIMIAVYLAMNASEINRVFQLGRYDIVLRGALFSLFAFLALFVIGRLSDIDSLTYLLILVFLPQLVNGLYIKRRLSE